MNDLMCQFEQFALLLSLIASFQDEVTAEFPPDCPKDRGGRQTYRTGREMMQAWVDCLSENPTLGKDYFETFLTQANDRITAALQAE
ncbi:MAG: hypothetical protein HOO67_01180 [Candidatus Peribacteraceae bacterium]|nr:hypothetical protein [Candidatus Peribacteraceae bacterium]